MEAILAGADRGRRHRRDPLRGPEGRSGHERDARDHRRDEGRRTRCGRRARHRRAVLGWHARLLRRARLARGRRRRTRSRSSRRATASSIDAETHTIDLLVDGPTLERGTPSWKPPEPRYTSGFLGEVRAARAGRRDGRDHQRLIYARCRSSSRSSGRVSSSPSSAPSVARSDRVDAPDALVPQRGLTPRGVTHRLAGRTHHGARRSGKAAAPRHERAVRAGIRRNERVG